MAVNDALHTGQANATSFELLVVVQALKGAKQAAGITHVKTCAVVTHPIHGFTFAFCRAKLNPALRFAGAEFQRIAQQILQHITQQFAISDAGDAGRHHSLHLALRIQAEQFSQHLLRQRAQINRPGLQLATADARQLQQRRFDRLAGAEGAAKEQLFKIFEALGPKSDIVKEGRRRLSALRFR